MFSFVKKAFTSKNASAEHPPPTPYEDPTLPHPPPQPPPPRSPLLDQITDRTKKFIPKVSLRNILPTRGPKRGETPSVEGFSHGTEGHVSPPTFSQASLPGGSGDSPDITGPRTPPNATEPIDPSAAPAERTSPPSSGSRDLPILPPEGNSPPRESSPPTEQVKPKPQRRHFSLTEEIKKNGSHLVDEASRREEIQLSPPKELPVPMERPVTVVRKISPAIRISEVVEEENEEEEKDEEAQEEFEKLPMEATKPRMYDDSEAAAGPSTATETVVKREEAEVDKKPAEQPEQPSTADQKEEQPLKRRASNIVYPNMSYFDDIGKEKEAIELTKDIYVEERKSFRRTRRTVLETAMRQASDDREAQGILETAAMKSVTHAIAFQVALNLLALMLQGFLSGLAVAHAVFAYVFADRDLLLRGYRWMSLPVHATFMVCFILGIMAAVDRVRWHEFSLSKLQTWINAFGGFLQLIPMIIGLAASEMSLYFDESVAPSIKTPELSESSISTWKILSTVRAACAVFSWISVAFQPTNTAILEHIGMFMLPEEARDAHDFYKEAGDASMAESRIPKVFGGVLEEMTKSMMSKMGVSSVPGDVSVLLKNAQALSSNPTDLPQSIPP